MTAPARRSHWSDSAFERMTDRNVDTAGYRQLHDDLAARGVDLSPEQAGNWAAAGFNAATAREFIDAGFAPNESGSAMTYHAAGLYDGTEAYLERLEDETNDLLYQADQIEEAAAEREADFNDRYEVDPETGLVRPRPEPDPDDWEEPPAVEPVVESEAEAAYADSWGDIEAERAQAQGEMREYVDEGTEDAEAHANGASSTGAVLDDIDSAIDEAEATSAGWTAEDQAAFEAEVDGDGGEPNPLYVAPSPDGYDVDDGEPWPPVNREPTADELESGVAVQNEDGSTSWSPTNNDFDWTDEQEERAAGYPGAQAADYSDEPYQDSSGNVCGEPCCDATVGPEPEQRGGLDFVGDLDEVQAGLNESSLPRPPARPEPELSEEAEEIARGVEQREAELDAMEADEEMVGSEAYAAHYWENGGEYPDGSHALDHEDQGDERGEAERVAQVEEDAAERASYEAEQREEYEAELAEQRAEQARVEQAHVEHPGPEETGGDDYRGPFDEGSADGYGQEEPF